MFLLSRIVHEFVHKQFFFVWAWLVYQISLKLMLKLGLFINKRTWTSFLSSQTRVVHERLGLFIALGLWLARSLCWFNFRFLIAGSTPMLIQLFKLWWLFSLLHCFTFLALDGLFYWFADSVSRLLINCLKIYWFNFFNRLKAWWVKWGKAFLSSLHR